MKFLFDENIPISVVRALKELGIKDIEHFSALGLNAAKDEEWMLGLQGNRFVVITYDSRILRTASETRSLRLSDFGLVVGSGANKPRWAQARDILTHWPKIEACHQWDRPFVVQMSTNEFKAKQLWP